jgi:hypothetical protein
MVLATMLNLATLAEKQVASLRWIKAHIGLTGNKKADSLAKGVSQVVLTAPEPVLLVSHDNLPKTSRVKSKKDESCDGKCVTMPDRAKSSGLSHTKITPKTFYIFSMNILDP